MSDYYYDIVIRTRHAELMDEARQDALIKSLPHRPGPLARIWSRLVRPSRRTVTRPKATDIPFRRWTAGYIRQA